MRVLAKIFYRGATWGKVSYQCPTLMTETSPMILITGLRFDNIRLKCRSARDNSSSSMAYGLSIVNLAVQDGCYMWSVSQKQLVISSTVVQILGITITETNEQTEPRYFASAKNVIVQSQYPSFSAGIQWINDATTVTVNTLTPIRYEQHFADDIFKCIFWNENVWISIKISLKFVLKGPINNIPALVQIMACRRPGDKPLSEPRMVRLSTHICVTRPQWVNGNDVPINTMSVTLCDWKTDERSVISIHCLGIFSLLHQSHMENVCI